MTILTAIGLMSGTSLDGIDAAVLKTDGQDIVEHGPSVSAPYSRDLKIWIRRAIKAALEGRDGAADIGKAGGEVTLAHVEAVEMLLEKANLKRTDIDVIGFHGQTILHRPAKSSDERGRTWQIGDGDTLAEDLRIDVVSDFRTADVDAGGEGAPLAPFFHHACARYLKMDRPVAFLNLGGVGNLTWVDPTIDRPEAKGALLAFDTGPANAPINDLVMARCGLPFDKDGALARKGHVEEGALELFLAEPYFSRMPPK